MATATKPVIDFGDLEVRFLVEEGDSGGAATVFECTVAAGAMTPPPHSHDGFDETVYGLEGTCTFTVDGTTRELHPGESICVQRGQVHQFINQGREPVRFVSVATPGIFGPDYFQDVHDVLAAAAGGPPDVAALVAVMRRHGLTPSPPV